MTKIAILGCGWLGFPLALDLLKDQYEVKGTTTSIEKRRRLQELGIDACQWTLDTMGEQIPSIFKEADVVIVNIPPSKLGTSPADLLQSFCEQLNPETKVIFISTTSVYPDTLDEANENYQWTAEDKNKQTVLSEIQLTHLLKNRLTILRLAGLIGEKRHPIHFLAGKIDLPNGDALVNLVQRIDVIEIIRNVLKSSSWGEVLNICSPEHPLRKDYYTAMADQFSLPTPTFISGTSTTKKVDHLKSSIFLANHYHSIFDIKLLMV